MTQQGTQCIARSSRSLRRSVVHWGVGVVGLAFLVLLAGTHEARAQQAAGSGKGAPLPTLKHVAKGTITKIEGDTYWVKLGSGAEVKLPITKDTNMVCPVRADEQDDLWQPTVEPAPVGFRIGDCPFRVGDVIKAETTSIGTVTFIRALDRPAPTTTQRLGLPQDYTGPILTPFKG